MGRRGIARSGTARQARQARQSRQSRRGVYVQARCGDVGPGRLGSGGARRLSARQRFGSAGSGWSGRAGQGTAREGTVWPARRGWVGRGSGAVWRGWAWLGTHGRGMAGVEWRGRRGSVGQAGPGKVCRGIWTAWRRRLKARRGRRGLVGQGKRRSGGERQVGHGEFRLVLVGQASLVQAWYRIGVER